MHSTGVARQLFAALAVAHLAARLTGAGTAAAVTQWLVMPALAAVVWSATGAPRGRLVRVVLLALGFSWLGDTVPVLFDGDTRFLVMVGLCLTLMAALATGVHPLAGVGGAVFFVSDGLIALNAFAVWYAPPVPGFWVMATYLAGQALIAAGVVTSVRRDAGAGRRPVAPPPVAGPPRP